jgi:hypothetical protein
MGRGEKQMEPVLRHKEEASLNSVRIGRGSKISHSYRSNSNSIQWCADSSSTLHEERSYFEHFVSSQLFNCEEFYTVQNVNTNE